MTKEEYLDKFVFQDLTNLNDGFDAEGIKYFSETDFEIVLRRVEKLGLGIWGIEPWKNREFYDVRGYKLTPSDPQWYWKAFEAFKKEDKELLYAATFDVPQNKLNT